MPCKQLPEKHVEEFIEKMRKPMIEDFVRDWNSIPMTLEHFISHVWISGVMYGAKAEKTKQTKNEE